MRRHRISSVPVGAVIVALAAIALMAFLAFYLGDSDVVNPIVVDPLAGSERGNR